MLLTILHGTFEQIYEYKFDHLVMFHKNLEANYSHIFTSRRILTDREQRVNPDENSLASLTPTVFFLLFVRILKSYSKNLFYRRKIDKFKW